MQQRGGSAWGLQGRTPGRQHVAAQAASPEAAQPWVALTRSRRCPPAIIPAARAEKAERVAPRPVAGLLRPVVSGQTVKYNTQKRVGRGFTLEELKVRRGREAWIGSCRLDGWAGDSTDGGGGPAGTRRELRHSAGSRGSDTCGAAVAQWRVRL